MEDELFGALAEMGITIGHRLISSWFAKEEQPNPYACMESIVLCSANSAARVFELLGIAGTANKEQFDEVVGMFAGSVTGAIAALTKQEPQIDKIIEEHGERICAHVYNEMQQKAQPLSAR